MVESVRESCKKGLEAYPGVPREQWVLQWPGQVRWDEMRLRMPRNNMANVTSLQLAS